MEKGKDTFENCPKCGAEVEHVQCGKVLIECCLNCKGLFVDLYELKMPEIDRFATAEGSSLRKDEKILDKMNITCPKCKVEMIKKKVLLKAGLTLDVCPSCHGIWFDRGELAQYVQKKFHRPTRIPVELICVECNAIFDRDVMRDDNRKCPRCQGWLTIKLPDNFFEPLIDKRLIIAFLVFIVLALMIFYLTYTILQSLRDAILFSGPIGLVIAAVFARVIVYKGFWKGYADRLGGFYYPLDD